VTALDGKAVRGVPDSKLIRLIEDLGGGTADGGPWNGDALNADEASFDAAAELGFGARDPQGETERAALARFKS
jgi:hypothetical protein